MLTTLELKSEKAKKKTQWVNIAEMLKNVRNFIFNLIAPHQALENEKKDSTSTLSLLKERLREFQKKELQLHCNIEQFFEKMHVDEKYNLYFLSYHLLLKKIAEIAYFSEKTEDHKHFIDYLQEQSLQIKVYFQHTEEEVKKIDFWGKDFLHDIMELIQHQQENNALE